MPSLRETKNRIKSVQNTEKITKAMKMVAASKLRRAQEAVCKPRPYASQLLNVISALAQRSKLSGEDAHPLLLDRTEKKKVMVIVLTSDRGLCGALNSSIVRMTQRFIFDNQENFQVSVSTIGKKGLEGLSRVGVEVEKNYKPERKTYDFLMAKGVADEVCQKFLEREIDGAFLIYNEFKSAIAQEVLVEQLLPVIRAPVDTSEMLVDYLYEPDRKGLLNALIPRHFATRLYQSFLESYASEQGARMTAMDNATRNAKEMTERLTLQYNRARQAAITKELMEIIGGAEAL